MGRLFISIFAGVAAACVLATAPARAVPTTTADSQQVYLQETQQVTGRAHLIFKDTDATSAVEGKAELVEYSQGLVVYQPSAAPASGPPAVADLHALPGAPVHTTTTANVSWKPARVLPTPRSF